MTQEQTKQLDKEVERTIHQLHELYSKSCDTWDDEINDLANQARRALITISMQDHYNPDEPIYNSMIAEWEEYELGYIEVRERVNILFAQFFTKVGGNLVFDYCLLNDAAYFDNMYLHHIETNKKERADDYDTMFDAILNDESINRRTKGDYLGELAMWLFEKNGGESVRYFANKKRISKKRVKRESNL